MNLDLISHLINVTFSGIPELVEHLTEILSKLTESATKFVSDAQADFQDLSNLNVDEEIVEVQENLRMAKNLSEHVLNITNQVETTFL